MPWPHLSLKRPEKDDLKSILSVSFLQCFSSALTVALMVADASASRHIWTSSVVRPCRLAWHCLMLVTDWTPPPSFTWNDGS